MIYRILIGLLLILIGPKVFAYKCDAPLDSLLRAANDNSSYDIKSYDDYFPLTINEVDTKIFNVYAGFNTSHEVKALYVDARREIVINADREIDDSQLQSCAVIVHEICHHLQNITGAAEHMTVPSREIECYQVQQRYFSRQIKANWNKKGNPMPEGPNGLRTVQEFKRIQLMRAFNPASDFNLDAFACLHYKLGAVICSLKK